MKKIISYMGRKIDFVSKSFEYKISTPSIPLMVYDKNAGTLTCTHLTQQITSVAHMFTTHNTYHRT